MTWGLTEDGFETETQAENREVIVSLFQGSFGDQVQTDTSSAFGNLIDVLAELSAAAQQEGLFTYQSRDRSTATGVALDQIGKEIGIPRDGATRSSSEGTITGTAGTVIPNLSRVRLNATSTVWEVLGGPHTIPVGETTITNVPLQSQDTGPITAIASGPTAWTIVDVIVGWTAWETTEDATPGRNSQTDKDYRASQDSGLFIRAQGPLLAISANVEEVEGVVTGRTFHNPTVSPVDSDGIPFKAVNVVVETDPAVPTPALRNLIALAIWNSAGAGVEAFGTNVTETIIDDEGQGQIIRYDLVSLINIWI